MFTQAHDQHDESNDDFFGIFDELSALSPQKNLAASLQGESLRQRRAQYPRLYCTSPLHMW